MTPNARILIVDDDEGMRSLLSRIIEDEGYRALTAADGQEALKLVERDNFDVVLTDLKMPGMDGLELLRRLRERDASAVVVIVTAYASLDSAVDALRYGAFDYLLKPFDDIDRVTKTVARAAEQRRQLKRDSHRLGKLQSRAVMSTGSDEIDAKMGGGVPLGSLTLIDGHSHAGKSVLAQQMMWGSMHEGYKLSFFTTENTVGSLITQMDSLNLGVLDFLLLRRLRVYPMEVARSKGTDLDALLEAIGCEGQRGTDIVFVDALTSLILSAPTEEVLTYFEGCKQLCSERVTIVNVVHSHAISTELLVRITSLCDAHICLRTEEAGAKLVKVMEVAKIRGASKNTGNIVTFEVEPGLGLRIVPINKAQG